MSEVLDRPNRYAATCLNCAGRVDAHKGWLARDDNGAWTAVHVECPEKPMAIAAPQVLVDEDGIYRTDDGTIYKVQVAVHGSGRLYAKRLEITHDSDGTAHGTFQYAAGAIHTLRADQRLTTEQAAAYGRLYGVCVACGATLTDEKSIERGLGPKCAGKYF